jgi:hypothetical protein
MNLAGNPVLTFVFIVVSVFAHFEMMNFLINTNCDRVISIPYTTFWKPNCLL